MALQSQNHKPVYEDQAAAPAPVTGDAAHQKVIPLHDGVYAEKGLDMGGKLAERDAPGRYLRVKDRDAEVKALYNGIVKYVAQKNFPRAERLRQELIRIAPSALAEIEKSDEIIARAKTALIDPKKIGPWTDLFKEFTPAEAAAFYSALRFCTVKPNLPVFQQGNCDNRLYFIQSGRCRLSYYDRKSKQNIVLANLKEGDIAGMEAFFTHTVHLATLIALEETGFAYLEKDAYQKMLARYPGIESKLCAYCDKQKSNSPAAIQKDREPQTRRQFRAALKARVHRINKEGKLVKGASEVRIVDIFSGGLSYVIRNMNITEAAKLKKSWVHITLSYRRYSVEYDLKKLGRVVSLRFDPSGKCLVHVEFKRPLEERKLLEIAEHSNVKVYL